MKVSLSDRPLQGEPFHDHPVLDSVYRRRGVLSYSDLAYSMKSMISPFEMKGMEEAVSVLFDCLTRNDRVVVVADYDCDGATSCAIAVEGLRLMGFSDVRFVVPDRFTMGYGLSPTVAQEVAPHSPGLVVTVDNGIVAYEGCDAVKALPSAPKLVITDHHLGDPREPNADAIVNPNRHGCSFASKGMAGCGVIFYVLIAFRHRLKEANFFGDRAPPDLNTLLDIVALGTVADVVPLDFNNRLLVYHGIRRIRNGETRPGILALCEVSGVDPSTISATEFGFMLGPRINSAGRLDDMTIGINCLLSQDRETADSYASELQKLNDKRKQMTADMTHDVYQQIDVPDTVNTFGLCVLGDQFNEGVIGIAASRIKESHHRPVIVFTRSENGTLKGSGRSVAGVHLRDILVDVDRLSNSEILLKYGGHAMAAGMTIRENEFERFRTLFDNEVKKHLPSISPETVTDGGIDANMISVETALLLRDSGPWGQGFPPPVFRGRFIVRRRDVLKGKHIRMQVSPFESTVFSFKSIIFNVADVEDSLHPEGTVIDMAYELSVNVWKGVSSVQLMVRNFSAVQPD